MPHPKNRLKLTGDTHLPDAGYDYGLDDEPLDAVVVEEVRVYADGYEPAAAQEMTHPEPPTTLQKVERRLGQETARKPWMMIGAGLVFGWLVTRMLRR